MEYYISFDIEIQDIDNKGYDSNKIAKYMLDDPYAFYPFKYQLKNFIKRIEMEPDLKYKFCFTHNDGVGWRRCNDEMIRLSKEFPEILFKVHCDCEIADHTWDKYFMNGKMQCCRPKVVPPSFDRSKLK